jgi:L-alanine-DL-glutamate epimerase-like enolase superfamily enzyme
MKLELRRTMLQTPGARDARRTWSERQRLLLRISDTRGNVGLGEAAPLPGYSPDALHDVEAALSAIPSASLQEALAPESSVVSRGLPLELLEATSRLLPSSLPSARMALETAALDYWSRRDAVSAPRWLGASADAAVRLACLVGAAGDAHLLQRAGAAIRDGYSHLKVKLGAPGRIREEIAGVVALRDAVGQAVSIRLDANGALGAADLTAAWSSLKSCGIQLFEEPGEIPPALLGELPLALDESLQGLGEAAAVARWQSMNACCVVLKPTALGGLAHCFRLARRAHESGVAVVISHCFEGSLAFRAAATLALALPGGLAHGLAPHAGLEPGRELSVVAGSLSSWSEPGLGGTEVFA